MGFRMPPILAIVGLVCAGVGLLFQIIGVATTGWLTFSSGSTDVSSGLWKFCINNACASFQSAAETDELLAARAFGIIGLLVLVGCVVVGVLLFFMDNKLFMLIAAILGFVAAFCIMLEFAIYAGKYGDNPYYDFGYSFALTILAFLLAIAAGVCFILAKLMGGKSE